ncbi:DUF2196 domain-containing protein [Deinococcus petrolearius]|uniref:DUF2196 domain-containing protein n=1 Tax=Deinococcus petrolearius TaxID=1751295 RepID=A0ABW1DKP4_9DEIO
MGKPVLSRFVHGTDGIRLTRGVVSALLTRSPSHPHGIKVRLTTGEVGRVQAVIGAGNQ